MATVTIEVPDELSELVAQAGDRLPKLLAQGLREPTLVGARLPPRARLPRQPPHS
jgi:hypothetical protein